MPEDLDVGAIVRALKTINNNIKSAQTRRAEWRAEAPRLREDLTVIVEQVNNLARLDTLGCESLTVMGEPEPHDANRPPEVAIMFMPVVTDVVRFSERAGFQRVNHMAGELILEQADNGLISVLVVDPDLPELFDAPSSEPEPVELLPPFEPRQIRRPENINTILNAFMERVLQKHWSFVSR